MFFLDVPLLKYLNFLYIPQDFQLIYPHRHNLPFSGKSPNIYISYIIYICLYTNKSWFSQFQYIRTGKTSYSEREKWGKMRTRARLTPMCRNSKSWFSVGSMSGFVWDALHSKHLLYSSPSALHRSRHSLFINGVYSVHEVIVGDLGFPCTTHTKLSYGFLAGTPTQSVMDWLHKF